jgi:hypothetical protein
MNESNEDNLPKKYSQKELRDIQNLQIRYMQLFIYGYDLVITPLYKYKSKRRDNPVVGFKITFGPDHEYKTLSYFRTKTPISMYIAVGYLQEYLRNSIKYCQQRLIGHKEDLVAMCFGLGVKSSEIDQTKYLNEELITEIGELLLEGVECITTYTLIPEPEH